MLFFFDLLRNHDYSIYINHKKRIVMKDQIKLFVLLFVLINGVVSLTSCEKEFDNQDDNRVELNNSLKRLTPILGTFSIFTSHLGNEA